MKPLKDKLLTFIRLNVLQQYEHALFNTRCNNYCYLTLPIYKDALCADHYIWVIHNRMDIEHHNGWVNIRNDFVNKKDT